MKKIGILSDTHGYIHPRVFTFFEDVDEIWHAGDIGSLDVLDQLRAFKPVRAVYGNIDGHELRTEAPCFQSFVCEKARILMTHIGGYPGRYHQEALRRIKQEKPHLFISGHSHILKVMPDKKFQMLHINPGAAGIQGIHQTITMVKLKVDGIQFSDLQVLDIPRT